MGATMRRRLYRFRLPDAHLFSYKFFNEFTIRYCICYNSRCKKFLPIRLRFLFPKVYFLKVIDMSVFFI